MTLDDQRDQLLFIMTKETDDPIQRAVETFTYIRDHPEILSESPFREITMEKIIELRAYIRNEHKGLTKAIRDFYAEKTVLNQMKMEQETNKSRSFHPLQNVMDDVWEMLEIDN
jgi:hypothetical protein